MTATRVRKYVSFDEDDIHMLERIRSRGTPEADALTALTGVTFGENPHEASVLHAIFDAGRRAVENKALELGFAREAEFAATHPDCVTWRRAMHGRRLRRPHLTTTTERHA